MSRPQYIDVAFPVQKATYTRLTTDPEMSGYTDRVFDEVAQDQAAPYIEIGDMDDVDWGARDISGFTLNHRIHIWTDNSGAFEGKIECRTIMNKILKAMTGTDLDLSGDGLKNVLPQVVGSRLLIEDKKGIISYHGMVEFSYIIQIL